MQLKRLNEKGRRFYLLCCLAEYVNLYNNFTYQLFSTLESFLLTDPKKKGESVNLVAVNQTQDIRPLVVKAGTAQVSFTLFFFTD